MVLHLEVFRAEPQLVESARIPEVVERGDEGKHDAGGEVELNGQSSPRLTPFLFSSHLVDYEEDGRDKEGTKHPEEGEACPQRVVWEQLDSREHVRTHIRCGQAGVEENVPP